MNDSRYFSHFLLIPFKHKCATSVADFASFFANFCMMNKQILVLFNTNNFSLNKVTNGFFKSKSAWCVASFHTSSILPLFKLSFSGFQVSVNAFLLYFAHFPSFSLLLVLCNNSSRFSYLLSVFSLWLASASKASNSIFMLVTSTFLLKSFHISLAFLFVVLNICLPPAQAQSLFVNITILSTDC